MFAHLVVAEVGELLLLQHLHQRLLQRLPRDDLGHNTHTLGQREDQVIRAVMWEDSLHLLHGLSSHMMGHTHAPQRVSARVLHELRRREGRAFVVWNSACPLRGSGAARRGGLELNMGDGKARRVSSESILLTQGNVDV